MTKLKLKKAGKMKSRIGASLRIHIIVILGAIFIFIAPLIHIELPKTNSKVESFKQSYEPLFKEIEFRRKEIRKQYNEGIISGDQKITQDDLLENEEKEFLVKYENELTKVKDNSRVFGWLTLRQFFIGFGIRLPYLFFTLLIVYLIYKIDTKDKYLNRTFIFLKIALFTISFYLIIWSFWDKQDFPKGYYYTTALFLGFIASLIVISFLEYRRTLEMKLKSIVRMFFDVIYKDIPDNDFIKPEKEIEYRKMRIKITDKVVGNE